MAEEDKRGFSMTEGSMTSVEGWGGGAESNMMGSDVALSHTCGGNDTGCHIQSDSQREYGKAK